MQYKFYADDLVIICQHKPKDIEGIPYVDYYKYLGITIDTNGSIEQHMKTL